MEWYIFLPVYILALILVLFLRIPVAFGIFAVGIVASLLIFGDIEVTSRLLSLSVISSVNSFTFTAIPLFILMGDVLFRARIAQDAIVEIAKLLRRVPGRLPMVAVAGGSAFGILSGSSLANTALLSRTLLPQMKSAGYETRLSAGSILAAGGLAMVFPPSALAILWGGVANVSIGPLLIAGIVPGILMALGYVTIVLWKSRKAAVGDSSPDAAQNLPPRRTGAEILRGFLSNLLLPGIIAVTVLMVIFTGIATPTEAAAFGALASIILAFATGRFSVKELLGAGVGSIRITGTIFILVMASTLYAQIMAYMGATAGLVAWVSSSIANGALMIFLIVALLVILSCFIDQASIMLITAPLLMPIVTQFGWDPVWFSIIVLVTLQIGNISPPFGMGLFVMKSTAPWLPLFTIYRAAVPWIVSDLVVVLVLCLLPWLVTFLPQLMAG
ncbi:TRAP C4-dicarboxylate transporter, DctM subunit [Corynebacterium glyciniphilum AJ 3170]|uniref:TRAP C4-dicarboxylate transporter, DctM subunit n=1 Tax=Corynebacterium glyciniphilum AJ 3170 TaxID=1404245 RepID=X5ED92_9CORY|nr:TRAP transporter large permease subunit [Corynebacterium glyciniphilum]AHW64601.1 TRAP C4-dicarboxylate transporter, DctM subunit [Corynebacterium glyciniphilum AJ 3170]